MRDRTIELLLAACRECGALALRDMWRELELLAGDRTFTTAEVCAHALLPENARVRAAIEAACGEVSPRKLGKILAKWEGRDIACVQIDCFGADPVGILWRVSATKLIPDRTLAADAGTVMAPTTIKGTPCLTV